MGLGWAPGRSRGTWGRGGPTGGPRPGGWCRARARPIAGRIRGGNSPVIVRPEASGNIRRGLENRTVSVCMTERCVRVCVRASVCVRTGGFRCGRLFMRQRKNSEMCVNDSFCPCYFTYFQNNQPWARTSPWLRGRDPLPQRWNASMTHCSGPSCRLAWRAWGR